MPICFAYGLIRRLMMMTIAEIDDAIEAAGLLEGQVLRVAGMAPRYLYNIRTGIKPMTSRTANRIRMAIAELKRAQREAGREKLTDGKQPSASKVAAQYRMAVGFVAFVAGVKPQFILAADPNRRATADPAWLKAANLRRIALYIANIYLNVPQADLARAAGMSKAAVSVAMNDVEDDRGNPEIEVILAAVEGAFEG
jgi:hypothetical protein